MNTQKKRVVYLIGAGASHGSIESAGCSRNTLMRGLMDPLIKEIGNLVRSKPRKYGKLKRFVNNIIVNKVDLEHIITFLDESPSSMHRQFAEELRHVFAKGLKKELREIERIIGKDRFALYSALLDMHRIEKCPEVLCGILSINYDEYIEAAVKDVYGEFVNVDYGLDIQGMENENTELLLLKLHGSFNWEDNWPIELAGKGSKNPLLIPPGIQKAKSRYPFNVLWELARDMLDCDVLRIIGCRLSGNDWDLLSLLFSTRNIHATKTSPYVIEVIDSPERTLQLQEQYPYLEVRPLLELKDQDIGSHFIFELLGRSPRDFENLDYADRKEEVTRCCGERNWFRMWLQQKAEAFERDLGVGSTATTSGQFQKLLQEV